MTSSQTSLRLAFLAGTVFALSACGGGGSDSPAPAPAPTPAPTPTPAPAPTAQQLVDSYIQSLTQLTAQTVPAKGEDRYALLDACYLGQGNTRPRLIANWDANPALAQANNAYLVGCSYKNVVIKAERQAVQAVNGTVTSREIDISFDEVYADGTVLTEQTETLVTGSSSGICATPQTGDGVRTLGNQRLVSVSLFARNYVQYTARLSDGSANGERVRRETRLRVGDPASLATYAVLSWTSSTGAPLSLKVLSPRIVRDATEMQGKAGNGSYADTDYFRVCGSEANYASANAATADCTQFGTTSENWGVFVNAPYTAASLADGDSRYDTLGLNAGATVTVQVYNDDGWKTVNGQQGKTPIGTYALKLKHTPYTLTQMAAAPAAYPVYKSRSKSDAELAAAVKATGTALDLSWIAAAAPNGEKFVASDLYTFRQGASATGGPTVRANVSMTLVPAATAASITLGGKPDGASATNYAEYGIHYINRDGRQIAILNRLN